MISPDEYLERIIAGIHEVTTSGADVSWNEKINGRQFDVVVRFKLGTLSYLVVIEVRNRTRRASATDVEAFVTKARDNHADKAVFVSAAGFQSGAIEVAKRHAIELFTVVFDDKRLTIPKEASFFTMVAPGAKGVAPTMSVSEPHLTARIEEATLLYEDGSEAAVPSEQSQMNYYVRKSMLADGRSLGDVFQNEPVPAIRLNESKTVHLNIRPPQHLQPPDQFFFPAGSVVGIRYTVTGRMGRRMQGNTRVEPNLFVMPVIYTNAVTNETLEFNSGSLPLGVKRVEAGTFYFICHPLNYYYCESIVGNTVKWYLVESFQMGELIQAVMTQDIKYSRSYIPVSEKATITRLQARLAHLKARP